MAKAIRSPEGYRKHLERTRERKRKKRLDPELVKKENQKALQRYWLKRAECIENSRRWREGHRDEVNKRRREHRLTNIEAARRLDKKYRESTLKHWIAKFRRGDCSLDELTRRVSEAHVRADERFERARRVYANDGGGDRKAASKPGKSEA